MNAIAAVFVFAAKFKIYALKPLTEFEGGRESEFFRSKIFALKVLTDFQGARKKRQRSDERIFVPVFVKYIYIRRYKRSGEKFGY